MMTQKQYAKLVKQISPPSPVGKDCLLAFLVGGLICTLGQGLTELYASALDKQSAATAASMTLVALSALLTGLSLYDDIAKAAGAGTLVPITGFANAISAPAVEFRTEGFILGVGQDVHHCRACHCLRPQRLGGVWGHLLSGHRWGVTAGAAIRRPLFDLFAEFVQNRYGDHENTDDSKNTQHPFAQHRQGHGEGFQHCFHLLTGP